MPRTTRWCSTCRTSAPSSAPAPARTTALQWLLTNDLGRIEPGRAQYTHLLDPDDAHVVDDIIVWWVEPERFFVMPNASNTDRLRALADAAVRCSRIERRRRCDDITAVARRARRPGPARARQAARRCRRTRRRSLGSPYRRWASGSSRAPGTRVRTVSRSTCPPTSAAGLWDALVDAGITPAGPRRARHAPARSRAAVARPRARSGHHAVAGAPRLGRALGQGRLPGPGAARSRARPRARGGC